MKPQVLEELHPVPQHSKSVSFGRLSPGAIVTVPVFSFQRFFLVGRKQTIVVTFSNGNIAHTSKTTWPWLVRLSGKMYVAEGKWGLKKK